MGFLHAATLPDLDRAAWIWGGETNSTCELRREFVLEARPTAASVLLTADNGYELFVNGALVGREVGAGSEIWQSIERHEITARLVRGRNIIGIHGIDLGGVRGVIAAVRVEMKGYNPVELATDASWHAADSGRALDYSHPEFVEGPEWSGARVVGPMGMAPWGRVAWSSEKNGSVAGKSAPRTDIERPGRDFEWPRKVAYIGEDCSVYVPLRGDAWGVAFRVGDWSRAYTEFDLPCPSKTGRKLFLLELDSDRAGGAAARRGGVASGSPYTRRMLIDAGSGVMGSPAASYDGKSLLIAMAARGEKFFHIYRVFLDGAAPTKLTDGPFHDIDPVELPDGRIAFTSTRVGTFEEYHQPPSRALFRMNADGSDIHLITSTLIFDNEPKVMANGRILFIRTDNFFDRAKVETQLHSIRPDGTDGLAEFAANVGPDYGTRLRAFGFGSPAPLPGGPVAYISSRGNFIGVSGGTPQQQLAIPPRLGDLAALPDGRLICTVLRSEGARTTSDLLGVIQPGRNRIQTIFESTEGAIHSPVFAGERERPPIIPDYIDRARADRGGATGFLFCKDARFTTKAKAGWDRIRAIRVLGAIPLTTRSSHSHIVHVGHETVELGTVPLAPDGSFNVEVPADMPLALQAVDAEGRSELNEMSWIYVRPGERRSCIGCHQPRESAPAFTDRNADALRSLPVKLLGQGNPHRFRGNNPGVTGLMDLQFERFRECASLNRNALGDSPGASRSEELKSLTEVLRGPDEAQRISAAQRLAVFRASEAAAELAVALQDPVREVRIAAAVALAVCGTRESVGPLMQLLEDREGVLARAAHVALENLTGRSDVAGGAAGWREWLAEHPWPLVEQLLLEQLGGPELNQRRAVVALGHVGSRASAPALRQWVKKRASTSPYPDFVKDNRTDLFTFSANSPQDPRTLQEAVRSLGKLRDLDALPLFQVLLESNLDPVKGNLFLVESVLEALGMIGTPEAGRLLVDTFGKLRDYWDYVGWYSDHPALYACHSSPVHARLIAALDAMGSRDAGVMVPNLIRSVPTDPDRGLFLQNDDYETVVGRLIRRSGRGREVIESCLELLGDARASGDEGIKAALSSTHEAWGGHPGPENRSAQILSLVCRDAVQAPRIREAFLRFRARPEEPVLRALGNPTWTPVRHWTLFYLARALGNLRDAGSVDDLVSVLGDELNEARHGRPDPSQPEIHLLHLDYTPCWRAAAAWALGRIGDRRARPALIGAIRNLDNAVDVRHAAAVALGRMSDGRDLEELEQLAAGYPEISVRKALREACLNLKNSESSRPKLSAQQEQRPGL